MDKLIFFAGFLIISLFLVESVYSELAMGGISPINQTVCLSSQDSKIIYYTVSSSSNQTHTFIFKIVDIPWIYTNDSVLMPPRSAIELPIYIVPKDIPDGNYTTRVWFCRQEVQNNYTGYAIRNCMEGNINIEVSERCRTSSTSNFIFILVIIALITIFYVLYLKLRGK